MAAGAGPAGQGQPTPEELLRQLVEEHGVTSFVFRRYSLERTGEWVSSDAGGDHEEGPIRDVKSKRRCVRTPRRSRPATACPRALAGDVVSGACARSARARGRSRVAVRVWHAVNSTER